MPDEGLYDKEGLMKEKPRELVKCPQCGEMYSPSYSRCPFCEEDGESGSKVRRGSRRRTVDRHAGQSARGGLIVVLILVLALLGWYLFGSDIYHNRNAKTDKTGTEAVAPTDDSVPAIAPVRDETEQPADETPADVTPADEQPADETPAEPPEETPTEEPAETVDVSGAKLNRSDFTLSVKGEKYTIRLSGTEAAPRWSIDNPNVATIAGDGTVTAVANGNTTVHCKVGNRDLTCVVRVRGTGSTAAAADAPMTAEPITPVAPPQPTAQTPATNTNTNTNSDTNADVSGAALNRTDFTLSRGDTFTMKVTGTTAAPKWDVDNPNVAVINESGVVTAMGSGSTKIHCKVGSRDLTCIVRVR